MVRSGAEYGCVRVRGLVELTFSCDAVRDRRLYLGPFEFTPGNRWMKRVVAGDVHRDFAICAAGNVRIDINIALSE